MAEFDESPEPNFQNADQLRATERTLRTFATAYILDAVGIAEAALLQTLERVNVDLGRRWQEQIEDNHGITVPFIRDLYATLLNKYRPHEAVAFILRGLGYVYPEVLVRELLSGSADGV